MANTIKLKTGSGSDPSASDLIVGEIAIRTDSGKLFTKKDNGSVAEISGGGGIDDGDKGDITVSNGGDTFTIDNGVVTSAKIADGTIVNADINASAAIAGSKIQTSGLFNSGVITAAQHNKLAAIEENATADMTATEVLSLISGDNIILGEISSTGDSTFAGNVTISSSDGGSSAAPELDLNRDSASPADADYLGQIKFTGESDDGSKEVYAKITGKIGDASSGTEDGILEIAHIKAGSNNISARFTSTDLKLINGTGLEVAGNISCDGGFLGINGTGPQLRLNDTNSENDFEIQNADGIFKIRDIDASADRLTVASSGQTTISGNLDCSSGVDVTGNITVTGTVDGVDIAARNTLFGGLTSSSGVLTNGVTATTQSAGNNTTRVATTAFVTTAVSNIVDSAPSALNTLNELAAALGDDANFSTTISNSIGTKMPLAGGEFTGNVTFSGSQTVDGRDLSVDGAKLDGIESGATADQTAAEIRTLVESASDSNVFTDADHSKLNGIEASATADQTASEILTLIKTVDGSGSGLDADTLDGISSASFLRSDAADTASANITINGLEVGTWVSGSTYKGIFHTSQSGTEYMMISQDDHTFISATAGSNVYIRNGGNDATNQLIVGSGNNALTWRGNKVFHAGNDGASSGLDSDLLDGQHGSYYLDYDNFSNTPTIPTNNNQLTNGAGYITATLTNEQVQDIVGGMVSSNTESGITVTYQDGDGTLDFSVASQTDNNFTNADHSKLDGIESGATADQSASEILTLIKTVDGAGSGLDADTLDGISSASFLRSDASDTFSEVLTLSKDTTDVINFSANSTNDNRGIAFNSRTAVSADYNDGYLRLNNASEFSNGVYTPLQLYTASVLRADGGVNVDGATVINGSGTIVASKVPTLNQNTTGSSGSCTGNAATATQLANARTIAGVSFNGTANISLNNNAITNGAGYVTSSVINSLNASNLSSGTIPDARFPSTLPAVDGSNLTGISAGATGGGSDEVFYENDQNVTTNYTITNGKNAMAAGPITINSGVTVTVGSGETLTIV